MNRSIVRLFSVVILLFTILVVWTSRWTVFGATALNHNGLNKLQYFASLKVKRGAILADNGEVLARSVRAQGGTWRRVYPQGSLFAQTIGYYFPQLGQPPVGLESARNTALKGLQNPLTNVFGSFNGVPSVGDDVYTTLDPKAQALARQLLENAVAQDHATSGSVVAIVPQTGAIRAIYSVPSYNDNRPLACDHTPGCSQFFDATQGRYPPGSTFKLVTTTAAMNSGKFTPNSTLAGPSPLMVSGQPLHNDGDVSYPPSTTLTEALTYSINTIYAQVGQQVGAPLMQQYMERYGFYSVPPLDYPSNQMSVSGELFYPHTCLGNKQTELLPLTSPCVDLGRTSIGQANLAVTPLQMAMVVAAIANRGKLMQPRLTSRVINSAGQTVQRIRPQVYDQVMKPEIATELQQMMRHVVEEGTGQAANLGGLNIGGKTGTATVYTKNGVEYDDAWFLGFPESDPRIAVAVELTDIPNGYGGTYAAPIAAQVIKTLLAEHQ